MNEQLISNIRKTNLFNVNDCVEFLEKQCKNIDLNKIVLPASLQHFSQIIKKEMSK